MQPETSSVDKGDCRKGDRRKGRIKLKSEPMGNDELDSSHMRII